MLWLFLASATAFFDSCKDVFSKRSLYHIDSILATSALYIFTVLFLSPLLLFIPIPEIGDQFFLALVGSGIGNAIAFSLLMRAIQLSDLSKVLPLTTFTPLFLLITSPILIGEFPNKLGVIGVIFIVTGAYVLNLRKLQGGWLSPFKALGEDPGTRIALLVAFIWSFNGNFDKLGVMNSSPLFWVVVSHFVVMLLLLPFAIIRYMRTGKIHNTDVATVETSFLFYLLPNLAIMGFFNALMVSCQMSALDLTLVAYVISVKRTSTILSVFWGYFLFQEKGLKERLLGAGIMVFGVFAIAFSQTLN